VKTTLVAAPIAFLILSGGCATSSPTPVSSELAPANLVVYAEGSKWTWERGGKIETSEVTSVDNDILKFTQNTGCSYTRGTDMFGPETSFENCGGHSGGSAIIETKGQLWPLQVGNRQSWTYQSNDATSSATQTRKCIVEGQERVTVPAGQFDAYKIVCKSKNQTRTSYYAPSAKSNVIVDNEIVGVSRNRYELVSVSIAQP